jgi:hypothetical protein
MSLAFFNFKMGLSEQAKIDNAEITGNLDDFGVEITLTASNGEIAICVGSTTKHHLGLNEMQHAIKAKTASVVINELNIIAANPAFPVRNSKQEVDLKNCLVNTADSSGIIKNYKVSSWLPDEKIGPIVLILEDYIP